MVVLAKTSNKLIRIREFRIDYIAHAQQKLRGNSRDRIRPHVADE
jgi:hypothetical protein